MLIPFPFAYLFGSAAIDLWARASGRTRWFRTGHHMNTLGLWSAIVAAVPGLVDYTFAVPPRSSARKRATNHMFANLSAVGLFAAARLGRGGEDDPPPAWAVAAEICGAGLLGLGGWLGGTLVYRNQIGVDHRYADAGKWQVDVIAADPSAEREVDVGAATDLAPDQMKLLRIGSRRVVLARTDRGYVAFEDRCTHRGGPLADGVLAGSVVQCPWHGSQFDVRTGEVKRGPAEERIQTFEVSEREGRVWLRLPVVDEHQEEAGRTA